MILTQVIVIFHHTNTSLHLHVSEHNQHYVISTLLLLEISNISKHIPTDHIPKAYSSLSPKERKYADANLRRPEPCFLCQRKRRMSEKGLGVIPRVCVALQTLVPCLLFFTRDPHPPEHCEMVT